MSEEKETPVTEETKSSLKVPTGFVVPVGVAAALLGVPMSYIGTSLTTKVDNLEASVQQITLTLAEIKGQATAASQMDGLRSRDRFSGTDAVIVLSRLKAANPSINIPDIQDLIGDER
jgi:hypothetical protein